MITEQHRKESLSRAYVQAVVAKAGCVVETPDLDYGVDLRITNVERLPNGYFNTGHTLTVQLKATTNYSVDSEKVVYDLEAHNYNMLVRADLGTPAVLVLMCLPKDEDKWLSIGTQVLELRHCAYWISLRGRVASSNSSTVRIEIPCGQVFCPEELGAIMQRIIAGELP